MFLQLVSFCFVAKRNNIAAPNADQLAQVDSPLLSVLKLDRDYAAVAGDRFKDRFDDGYVPGDPRYLPYARTRRRLGSAQLDVVDAVFDIRRVWIVWFKQEENSGEIGDISFASGIRKIKRNNLAIR